MPTQLATTRHNVVNVVPEFQGEMPTKGVKLFIDQYLIDFNAAQAAVRAGRTKRWSESHGAKFLKKYAAYVEWQQKIRAVENARVVALDQEGILSEMELIATANIQDYFTWKEIQLKDGKKTITKNIRVWKDPGELTRAQAAAVKRVELSADGQVTDYILYDKDSNLFSLGRHLGMFSEKVILEHRHKHLHAKIDLSKMPIEKLLEMENEFVKYIPEHQREAQ
jgi:phage terminase small subunit